MRQLCIKHLPTLYPEELHLSPSHLDPNLLPFSFFSLLPLQMQVENAQQRKVKRGWREVLKKLKPHKWSKIKNCWIFSLSPRPHHPPPRSVEHPCVPCLDWSIMVIPCKGEELASPTARVGARGVGLPVPSARHQGVKQQSN